MFFTAEPAGELRIEVNGALLPESAWQWFPGQNAVELVTDPVERRLVTVSYDANLCPAP